MGLERVDTSFSAWSRSLDGRRHSCTYTAYFLSVARGAFYLREGESHARGRVLPFPLSNWSQTAETLLSMCDCVEYSSFASCRDTRSACLYAVCGLSSGRTSCSYGRLRCSVELVSKSGDQIYGQRLSSSCSIHDCAREKKGLLYKPLASHVCQTLSSPDPDQDGGPNWFSLAVLARTPSTLNAEQTKKDVSVCQVCIVAPHEMSCSL